MEKTNVVAMPDGDDVPRKVNWLRASGVPPTYESYRLDNYQGNDALVKTMQAYVRTDDSLLLMGSTGVGKTHLVIGMLNEFLKTDRSAAFITVPELLLKIRATFRDNATQTEDDLAEYYTSRTLLILDDMGAEKTTEYSISILYLIIDRRHRYGEKTIITTNLSFDEIECHLGARIASRLADSKTITFTNIVDWRKKRGDLIQ